MSSHFTKYQTHNESNIPIPKRTQTGIKKSKRCAQLPELQRYIETIIKASNDCDSEDTSISDRDKFPKDRKFGKYSVFKGLSSKITQDKINYDFNLTRSKSYNKSKTPKTDAVSRDDKIYNKYVREFEDPRNWKLDKTVCLGPKPEIEKFLKKFYPNPYHLENINELKGEKDDLRDVTLPDVISKSNTEVNIEKTDIVPADKDIEPCRRASIPKIITRSPSSEKHDNSQSGSEDVKFNTTSAPTLTKKPCTPKTNNSTSNSSSKVSSLESIQTFRKESNMTLKNRKHQKSKTNFKSIEKNDCDIGKLKFLSATDSNEVLKANANFKNLQIDRETEGEVAEQSDFLSNLEFGNMREIYKIMNKATETILSMESKDSKTIRLSSKLFDNSTLSIFYSDTQQDGSQFRKENLKIKNTTCDNCSAICRSEQNHASGAPENDPPAKKFCGSGKEVQEISGEEESECEASNSQQNIDEVVDFIYECLRKFSNKEKSEKNSHQNVDKSTVQYINEEPTTSHLVSDNNLQLQSMTKSSSENITIPKQFTKTRQDTEHRAATQLTRLKCKRQRGTFRHNLMEESDVEEAPLPSHSQIPVQRISEVINPDPRVDELHHNNENASIATAESQNELGGFTEEPQVVEESKSPKSNLPLPVKLKSIEINTCKTLINALEEQERHIRMKDTEVKENLNLIVENEFVIVPSVTTFREIEHFKQNIVIKSSIPQRIQRMKYREPNLELLNIETAPNQLKRSEFEMIKLSIGNESWCRVTKRVYDYRREEIITAVSDRPAVAYTVLPVCEKAVFCTSKTTEGPPKTPSNHVRIFVRVLEPSNPSSSIEISESSSTSKNSSEVSNNNSTTQTQILQETKEILSQKNSPDDKIFRLGSPSLTTIEMKDKSSQSEIEGENYRKKVHELLLRAYSLEQKLQKCLQIMTCLESSSSSNISFQEKAMSDVRSALQNKLTLQPDSPPVVHWHLKPAENNKDQKLGSTTVDHGTTYEPPENEVQEEPSKDVEQQAEKKQSTPENEDEDDNGDLSDSSFKSSIDISEVSERPKLPKEKMSKKRFSKKAFSQIGSSRESTVSKTDIRKAEDEPKPPDTLTNNQLTHYDSKTPAKVLKTVFKGKKSLTELTIGLKDVQMTKVGNISVEKTKYSPNHTKISICISRKNSENKFPPYVFDQVRPSISSCLTDLSRIKDTMSKTSQSNGETDEDNDEEDEEDYKSVASTLSHTDEEEEKPKSKIQKPPEVPRPKNSTKHRFDFYRKMNLDVQSNKSKRNSLPNSVCRYKELEPLKQALTEMQIRMRSIKKDTLFSSNEYYERALRLAKMSAGFCQSCGNRAVIPNDTFGYYRSLLPGKSTQSPKLPHLKNTIAPKSSFYALPLTRSEVKNQAPDLGLRKTPCSFHTAVHTNRTILRSPLRDMPIVFEGV